MNFWHVVLTIFIIFREIDGLLLCYKYGVIPTDFPGNKTNARFSAVCFSFSLFYNDIIFLVYIRIYLIQFTL